MTLVIDASVALRWLFSDEQSEAADAVLGHLLENGGHAPSLFSIEVANALNVGSRRKRIADTDLHKGVSIIEALRITYDEVDQRRVLRDVAVVARMNELSVYDAMYLELAMRLGVPLATFDDGLTSAAARTGVSIWQQTAE